MTGIRLVMQSVSSSIKGNATMAIQWSGDWWLRKTGCMAARASLIVLLCQLSAGYFIGKWGPEWNCSAIESNGKELMCGQGYGLPLLDVANKVALWGWITLYFLGVSAWLAGWVARKDKAILLVLSCVLIPLGIARLAIGTGDSP